MEKLFVTTTESPIIILAVDGNLRVKGSDELEVSVKSPNPEEVSLEQDGDRVNIKCPGDITVRVPRDARVQIDEAHGEVVIKALDGELNLKKVDGNLTLRSVGPVRVDIAHGDLEAKNVEGDLIVQVVDGNLSARDVQGNFSAEKVHGNLQIYDVNGSVKAEVEGNISMTLDPAPGENYSLKSQGNIACNVPEDASIDLEIPKASGRITINIPGVQDGKNSKAPYQLTIGEGDAKMVLSAEGNIVISGQMPGFEMPDFDLEFERSFEGMGDAIGQQVEQQIEAQMRMMEEQLNSQLSNLTTNLGAAGLSPEQLERIRQRAREASERATARAQEKMRQAQERLERRMAATQARFQRKARMEEAHARHREHRPGAAWPVAPVEPFSPVQDPVSDEERLTVLRLLEQKKITLDEAESLLAALEGKEG